MDALAVIRAQYTYLESTRRAYVDAVERLGWAEATRDRGASHPSLVDILAHTMDAYRWWFAFVLQDRPDDWTPPEPAWKASFAALRAYEREIQGVVDAHFAALTPAGLDRAHRAETGSASVWREHEILLHMIEEELQHRGELNALLWQMDVDAPVVGYDDWALARR